MEWRDQGWGNRKGRLAVALVRGQSEEVVALQSTEGLGVAPHRLGKATAEVNEDDVVTQARPGDFYRFFGNAGGGGGHELVVKNFKAIARLQMTEKVEYSCSDRSKEVPKWLSQSKRGDRKGKTALDNLALVY